MCTVDECNQVLAIRSITAAGGDLPSLQYSFPSMTGMPVTSEVTVMKSPLIIYVEGGGLAFGLARDHGALYLAWRRKLLLIYETASSLCKLLLAYLVLPISLPNGEQFVWQSQQGMGFVINVFN